LDYPLTSLLTYYGNPFWYEVGHFFPALWVNYSPALTLVRVTPAPRTENTDSFAREPFLRNADRKLRMYFR